MNIPAVITAFLLLHAGNEIARSADAPRGYDAFRLVRTRNIFDPNRQANRPDAPRQERTQTAPNFLALTGTMVTESKALAFFSGGGSESSKVAAVGETVGSYKLKSIAPEQVELEKEGKAVTLAVGRQLTLDGTITVAAPATTGLPSAPPTAGGAPAPTVSPNESAPTPAAPGGDKNELLKRMMERRAKEMSK